MKTSFKVIMTFLIMGLSVTLSNTAYAMAQISFQNHTKYTLKLYIDGNFGCGPVLPRGFCTSSVNAGTHYLDAKKGDEIIQHEEGIQIGDGTSPTWTVTIEETPTLEGKWMYQSSWSKRLEGNYETFTRSGDIYSNEKQCPKIFYGGPTEYTCVFTPSYECLLNTYEATPGDSFARILQQLDGKITFNVKITLSPDGNTATIAIDEIAVITSNRETIFKRLETRPFANISTLVRVSLRP